MTKRYRDSVTGRYIDLPTAEANPAGSVAEAVRTPDLEAGAEAFYGVWVQDGPDWGALSQEYRDRLRHALKRALEAL